MKENKAILVVDDELPVLKSITKALAKEGYEVVPALSGDEALSLAKGRQFDAAVTDLMMPGMSGLELLRKIKQITPDMPLIMVTGYPSVKAAVESMKAGAFDYLPKPFTPEELRGQVARAMARRDLDLATISPKKEEGFCIPENSWLTVKEDGNIRVGAHPIFLRTLGEIADLVFPDPGEMRYQGEPCVKLLDGEGRLHTLWAPASGKVIEVNRGLSSDKAPLVNDPYGLGWLLVLTPVSLAEDVQNLVPLG